jgi:hypothetical protein
MRIAHGADKFRTACFDGTQYPSIHFAHAIITQELVREVHLPQLKERS